MIHLTPRIVEAELFTTVGSEMHELVCDAFLKHHGYVVIHAAPFEVLYVTNGAREGQYRWVLRVLAYAGAA